MFTVGYRYYGGTLLRELWGTLVEALAHYEYHIARGATDVWVSWQGRDVAQYLRG